MAIDPLKRVIQVGIAHMGNKRIIGCRFTDSQGDCFSRYTAARNVIAPGRTRPGRFQTSGLKDLSTAGQSGNSRNACLTASMIRVCASASR